MILYERERNLQGAHRRVYERFGTCYHARWLHNVVHSSSKKLHVSDTLLSLHILVRLGQRRLAPRPDLPKVANWPVLVSRLWLARARQGRRESAAREGRVEQRKGPCTVTGKTRHSELTRESQLGKMCSLMGEYVHVILLSKNALDAKWQHWRISGRHDLKKLGGSRGLWQ